MPLGECNQLLVMLTVHLLRGPRQPLDGTIEHLRLFLDLLRVHYVAAGTPYGDDDPGFQRWLLDYWPAPPMA